MSESPTPPVPPTPDAASDGPPPLAPPTTITSPDGDGPPSPVAPPRPARRARRIAAATAVAAGVALTGVIAARAGDDNAAEVTGRQSATDQSPAVATDDTTDGTLPALDADGGQGPTDGMPAGAGGRAGARPPMGEPGEMPTGEMDEWQADDGAAARPAPPTGGIQDDGTSGGGAAASSQGS